MSIQSISVETAKQWHDNHDVVFIDVREPNEFMNQHIPGATLLPLGRITATDIPDTAKKVVIYCQKGMRGNKACNKVIEESADLKVYNLEGGISAWAANGLSLTGNQKKSMPIDQQVQVTIGTGLLAGSLAAYFVNPLFIALPAFFGAGLLFAGITGTCGLAILMAKCPWNKPNN